MLSSDVWSLLSTNIWDKVVGGGVGEREMIGILYIR